MKNQKKWEIKSLIKKLKDHEWSFEPGEREKQRAQVKHLVPEGAICRLTITPYDAKKEEEDQRSLAQNRYYHLLLDIICAHTGDEHLDLHENLKVRLLGRPYVLGDREVIVVKSTRDLTTKEFGDYLEKVFRFASEHFELVLPTQPIKHE